jgi:hypothetical protein
VKKILVAALATAALAGCSTDDEASTTTRNPTLVRIEAEMAEEQVIIDRYVRQFKNGWDGYTSAQKNEFCFTWDSVGVMASGRNAFEAAKADGATLEEAKAAERASTCSHERSVDGPAHTQSPRLRGLGCLAKKRPSKQTRRHVGRTTALGAVTSVAAALGLRRSCSCCGVACLLGSSCGATALRNSRNPWAGLQIPRM